MALSEYSVDENETLFQTASSLSEIDNDSFAASFAFAISIESMETILGMEAEGYVPLIFDEWLRRIGRIPYSKELNQFVYEHLPEFDLNALVQGIGEEGIERILTSSLTGKDDESEYVLERIAAFVSKLNEGARDELYRVVAILEKKSQSRIKAIAAVFAHLLNKTINVTYPAASLF